ncbi:MAG: exodeoxyribonuclease V subunit gamma, partial [Deltaproteobacteria bacterium]|nr:exodeoxyribonuclease V subunit gamma [Deltaproteobacteria bacterium]
MRSLISIAMLFAEPATLEQWYWRLSKALDDLFSWDETWEQEVATLRRIVSDLRLSSQESGFGEPVSFKVIKNYLETQLEDTGLSGGFLSRGVTFCSILPMRSIPFKVVCLIGMNHDAYPRQSRKLAFDLMAVKPRKGDRSRRNDDRYLFLEALLSARRRLIISYVGQSERDNSKIPPSPLVSELMDYLDRNFVLEDGVPSNRIVYEHRLHSFNISYFEPGSGLFTYFDENLSAARTAYESRKQPSHLFK